jgi:hypothetical protein
MNITFSIFISIRFVSAGLWLFRFYRNTETRYSDIEAKLPNPNEASFGGHRFSPVVVAQNDVVGHVRLPFRRNVKDIFKIS